jgi:hypothetical protein
MSISKKFPTAIIALSAVLLTVSVAQAAVDTIRVNSGGPEYTDSQGKLWAADSGFSGGQTYSATSTIEGTPDQALHQDERWDSSPFTYTFKVSPGSYAVRLYEASLYAAVCNSGGRRFNVLINGVQVLTDYDMFDDIGACLTAKILTFYTVTATGTITVEFTIGSASNPKINAIEIYPGVNTSIKGSLNGTKSNLLVSSSNNGISVQTQTQGAFSLVLRNLKGELIGQKLGTGAGMHSFTNLNPGLYTLTSTIDGKIASRTISVVR